MSAARYVDVRNATASKERVMVMLLETGLRHMRGAMRCLQAKDRRAANPLLMKACDIVLALQSTLKPEAAPKLVGDLIELYTFIVARLSRALTTGNPADVRQAERAFVPIVEGFIQAVAATTQAATGASAPATNARR